MARAPHGWMLLAVSQTRVRPRRGRLVARSGRRARRAIPAGAHPHVLGGLAALATRGASVRLAPQWILGHAAVRRVPLVWRRLHDVGDAPNAGGCRDQRRPLGDAVLGY